MKANAGILTRVALAAAIAAAGNSAAADIAWKAQVWGPKRAFSQSLEWYAKEVAARTAGKMKLDLEFNKGKPTESADLMKKGALEGVYFCAQYYPDKMPLTTVLDLPMLSPDNVVAMGRVTLALADHPAIQAELKRWNTKMLLPVPLSQYQLMGTRRVSRIDDLKGATVRISAEMGKILQEYGAAISVIPGTESAVAMKAGKIDLAALPYPGSFAAFNIDGASKFVTPNISLGGALCYLGVNQKSWDALPGQVQKVMLSLREPLLAQYQDAYAREDAAIIAGFKQKGLEFVSFNPADRARLLAKAIKVWQGWVEEREKQGLKGREVFEFTQAKIREFDRK
jgi:TRAP-type C4-dicarboxylate transport system substrate-binding protein